MVEHQIDIGLTRGMQIFIARHGVPLLDEAFGVRGQDDEPVTTDTRFCIYSTSKSLTATAIHLLVERGLVLYTDPVAMFVSEFGTLGKEAATIRHLLLHQGGFPDAQDTIPAGAYNNLPDAVAHVCRLPAETPPGTATAYHVLTGATMLAEVVQRVTGRDFVEFTTAEIFTPLALTHTTWGVPTRVEHEVSDTVGVDPPTEMVSSRWRSAEIRRSVVPGIGAHSTARDLGRLFQALLDGGAPVLSPATVAHATSQHAPITTTLGFGYGFFVGSESTQLTSRGTLASPRSFGHPGMCSSQAYADPSTGLVVAMLANVNPGQQHSDRRFSLLCDTVARALAR